MPSKLQHDQSELIPLLRGFAAGSVVSWRHGQAITLEQFWAHVSKLAPQLPRHGYIINMVSDRYLFIVAFLAALLRGQISLLPPNQAPKTVAEIARQYQGVYILSDHPMADSELEVFQIPEPESDSSIKGYDGLAIPGNQMAVIVFTSGSTGNPKANQKTWACLVSGAEMAHCRFWGDEQVHANIVATVPQQHMYGLETTIMQPLQCGFAVHSGRPFYPEDVKRALEEVSEPRVLITTPLHIKACVNEEITFPPIHHIISATAPLSKELAQQAEDRFQTRVLEIYGCTEAGSIATRRTVEDGLWSAYDRMRMRKSGDNTLVDVPELEESVKLGDFIDLNSEREFSIHGRVSDLINIAGKRASLGDLNHKLTEIPGVLDGAFLMPDEEPDKVQRLIAFVVAPELSKEDIINALRQHIDPIFLPRPLHMVDALPRTESSKIPRHSLLGLARQLASNT